MPAHEQQHERHCAVPQCIGGIQRKATPRVFGGTCDQVWLLARLGDIEHNGNGHSCLRCGKARVKRDCAFEEILGQGILVGFDFA